MPGLWWWWFQSILGSDELTKETHLNLHKIASIKLNENRIGINLKWPDGLTKGNDGNTDLTEEGQILHNQQSQIFN